MQAAQDGAWDSMKTSSYRMLYVAGYTFVTWVIMVFGLNVAASRIQHRLKIQYFKKCLEKDAAFYDLNNPMEMSSKISKETSVIGAGMGQKIGHVIQGYGAVIAGLTFAFLYGWLMTLILFVAFPIMAILMGFQN